MFGLGAQELMIILVLVLIIFGAGKLPTVGSALGKGIRNFKVGATGEDSDEAARLEKET
jgi:sec-independent protein translocase protein TatA